MKKNRDTENKTEENEKHNNQGEREKRKGCKDMDRSNYLQY